MSLPTNIKVYNPHNNLNQIGTAIGYANSGGIYNNLNNKNENIALNINNVKCNTKDIVTQNINIETKNNLQNITKERENNLLVNNIETKKFVQKSVYQKRNNNNNLFYDNKRGNSYPLSDNSRNQMTINNEYLAKINKNNNIGNDQNIQKEQKTEIIEIAQPPILINNTGVPIADTKFFKNDKCNCRRAFMITVKVILVLLLFGLIILCCIFILRGGGGSSISSGNGGGGSSGGRPGRSRKGPNCCCCCSIYRWIKSDKWCSKD